MLSWSNVPPVQDGTYLVMINKNSSGFVVEDNYKPRVFRYYGDLCKCNLSEDGIIPKGTANIIATRWLFIPRLIDNIFFVRILQKLCRV